MRHLTATRKLLVTRGGSIVAATALAVGVVAAAQASPGTIEADLASIEDADDGTDDGAAEDGAADDEAQLRRIRRR